ncbi:hypothetical protein J3D55_000761 [Chryseobacterium ginsenosidimutans]|uniref:hypothetical protein n=1 Tax=Chryseobacterium ginsenosidimutans TaxID=687846 RepID=UPI00216A01FA|nr:hypothetical protein [Chryseobacterium ginsenosidimutans]MCS3867845.1 hypothetical protein [Chryseobacterium ginsenosidimutans]
MKKFLLKLSFYLAAGMLVFAVLGSFADGNTDDNYMHFAVEKPHNIILGDSRGSQAVLPSILKDKLHQNFDNFSLNVVQSPYGPIYLEALKRKINPDTKNGVFILTVDPWNLSLDKNVKSPKDFPEEHSPLKNMYTYDFSPNYEYLLRNYGRSWFKIFTEREAKGRSNTYLHKDGWLEVNVNMQKDSVAKRETEKIDVFYANLVKTQSLSKKRLNSLEDIIQYLQPRGTVYLVRIPGSERLMKLENSYTPDFSEKMKAISKKYGIKFFDFSSKAKDYIYTDGNHMYKESGKVFTAQVADSILLHTKISK